MIKVSVMMVEVMMIMGNDDGNYYVVGDDHDDSVVGCDDGWMVEVMMIRSR